MNRKQNGFTLVEMAIVLMVIGLIIGSVLGGQRLIENSNVVATISQVTSYQKAVAAFRSTYGALPGDIRDPARLPNCTVARCNTAGDGNGKIGAITTGSDVATYAVPSEVSTFWVQLGQAEFIPFKALNGTGTASTNVVYGEDVPDTPLGGGFNIRYFDFTYGNRIIGQYFLLTSVPNNFYEPQALSPRTASLIDLKADDGIPESGSIVAVGPAGSSGCKLSSTVYNGSYRKKSCNLIIKMQ